MNAAVCPSCAAAVPPANRFCGQCGVPLGGTPAAAPPSALRRYRGPLWLGGCGTVLFVAGAGVATAIFSAVQVEAAPGILVDLFSPWIDEQVQGTVAEDVIDITGVDGGTDAKSLGLAAAIGLVGGALVAALGLVLMLIAAAWGANRAMGSRRSGTVTIATPPPAVQYPAPSFHTAPPPTWTQAPPPAAPPPPPPTFTPPPR